jgi:hypothetical protein
VGVDVGPGEALVRGEAMSGVCRGEAPFPGTEAATVRIRTSVLSS